MVYKLRKSKRKSIAIKITDNAQVVVYAPISCKQIYIDNFVKEKQNWINNKLKKQLALQSEKSKFNNLEKILIMGNEYKIYEDNKGYVVGDYFLKKNTDKQKAIKMLLVKIANNYIAERLPFLSSKLKISYDTYSITSSKRYWGSCSITKKLKFNFKTIMLPSYLIDYIICHELCHIKEFNHSKKFWGMLEDLGYKKTEIRQSLSKFSYVLNLF